MKFSDVFQRIQETTTIKNMVQLAEIVGCTQQNVSVKKKEGVFPADWAFKVGQSYKLSTDWIMTGEGPKRLGEGLMVDDKEAQPKGIIEEWIQEVREKEGNDGRIVMELSLQVEEFRTWFQEHKSKAPLENPHEKKSEAA